MLNIGNRKKKFVASFPVNIPLHEEAIDQVDNFL